MFDFSTPTGHFWFLLRLRAADQVYSKKLGPVLFPAPGTPCCCTTECSGIHSLRTHVYASRGSECPADSRLARPYRNNTPSPVWLVVRNKDKIERGKKAGRRRSPKTGDKTKRLRFIAKSLQLLFTAVPACMPACPTACLITSRTCCIVLH